VFARPSTRNSFGPPYGAFTGNYRIFRRRSELNDTRYTRRNGLFVRQAFGMAEEVPPGTNICSSLRTIAVTPIVIRLAFGPRFFNRYYATRTRPKRGQFVTRLCRPVLSFFVPIYYVTRSYITRDLPPPPHIWTAR